MNESARMRTMSFTVVTASLAALTAGLGVLLGILLRATPEADPRTQAFLARLAWFTLVLLGIAALLLVWTVVRYMRFRIDSPRRREPAEYVDAWAEAGRRATPDDEDEPESDEDEPR